MGHIVLGQATLVTRSPEGGREKMTFSMSGRAERWHHQPRMFTPEQQARIAIDQLLTAAGWAV
jgi:hypothetical protein